MTNNYVKHQLWVTCQTVQFHSLFDSQAIPPYFTYAVKDTDKQKDKNI